MNFKNCMSVMLASTTISTAISGAASACPGLEFAIDDQISAHELMRRPADGALFPSQNAVPHIHVNPIPVGETRKFAFSVHNAQTGANFIYLGGLGHPVNDTFNDYIVTVQVIGGTNNTTGQAIAAHEIGANGNVPGLINIYPTQAANALVVEFQAQGPCNVNGEIRITSNTSALQLRIPFDCTVV